MGFRSTLCSEDYYGNLPDWFKTKYDRVIHFHENSILVTSKTEAKYYSNYFFEDYSKALHESKFWEEHKYSITLIVLAEDGFISKVVITSNDIKYYWVDGFTENDHVWSQG